MSTLVLTAPGCCKVSSSLVNSLSSPEFRGSACSYVQITSGERASLAGWWVSYAASVCRYASNLPEKFRGRSPLNCSVQQLRVSIIGHIFSFHFVIPVTKETWPMYSEWLRCGPPVVFLHHRSHFLVSFCSQKQRKRREKEIHKRVSFSRLFSRSACEAVQPLVQLF